MKDFVEWGKALGPAFFELLRELHNSTDEKSALEALVVFQRRASDEIAKKWLDL